MLPTERPFICETNACVVTWRSRCLEEYREHNLLMFKLILNICKCMRLTTSESNNRKNNKTWLFIKKTSTIHARMYDRSDCASSSDRSLRRHSLTTTALPRFRFCVQVKLSRVNFFSHFFYLWCRMPIAGYRFRTPKTESHLHADEITASTVVV